MDGLFVTRIRLASLLSLLIATLTIAGCTTNSPDVMPVAVSSKSAASMVVTPTAPSATSQAKYELTDAKCDENQCLFKGRGDDFPISLGLVTLKGYYQQMEVELDNLQKINCDYFVVTGGSAEFQREFLALIDFGNTVNRRNEAGQLVLGIDLRALDPIERDKVVTATAEQPVNLIVLSPTPPASMGGCLTFINIIKVK
jgi:hypothetical protein